MTENTESFSHEARNGLITAIGIVLGFALAFFGTWSIATPNDQPWVFRKDAPAVTLLTIGVFVLTAALQQAILPYHQTVKRYERAAWIFMGGIVIVFLGFLAAIFNDAIFKG